MVEPESFLEDGGETLKVPEQGSDVLRFVHCQSTLVTRRRARDRDQVEDGMHV